MVETMPDGRERLLLSLRRLSDDQLLSRLKGLAARARRATALLVAHLAELDTRDVYLRAGYSSLFTYCREVLGLSEDEAYNRTVAARMVRRFPVILDLLSGGGIHVTSLRLLAPHLTPENHLAVLESARGKRKSEVEEIVASLCPRADVPTSIRRLPQPTPPSLGAGSSEPTANVAPIAQAGSPEPAASLLSGAAACSEGPVVVTASALAGAGGSAAGPRTGPAPTAPAHCSHPAEVTPLSPKRYKYQVTIGGPTLQKLRLAKEMTRHALPSGDDEALLDRALTALLRELARQKFGGEPKSISSAEGARLSHKRSPGAGGARPGGSCRAAADSRCIPVEVKRAVWVRDLGSCAFVAADGRRCAERAFVEFHHVRPWAAGGEATLENIQLRCWRHNAYEARVFFAREPVTDDGRREGTATAGDRHQPIAAAPVRGRARQTRCRCRSGTAARDRDCWSRSTMPSRGARSGAVPERLQQRPRGDVARRRAREGGVVHDLDFSTPLPRQKSQSRDLPAAMGTGLAGLPTAVTPCGQMSSMPLTSRPLARGRTGSCALISLAMLGALTGRRSGS